jgi:hypothetical protein
MLFIYYSLLLQCFQSRGSWVSIETKLWAGHPGFDSRQGQLWVFSYRYRCVQTASGAHSASYSMAAGDIATGAWSWSHPSNAEVNAWSYTSTHQYVFIVWHLLKHRENFTVTMLCTVHEKSAVLKDATDRKPCFSRPWNRPRPLLVISIVTHELSLRFSVDRKSLSKLGHKTRRSFDISGEHNSEQRSMQWVRLLVAVHVHESLPCWVQNSCCI